MIQEIRIPFLLPPIFALSDKIPDLTPEEFKENVLKRLVEKDSTFIVYKKDGKVLGFLFCTVDTYRTKDAYVIQYAYVEPDAFSVGSELMARACENARNLGLKDIYMMTSRNPEAFERKYKFEKYLYVLKRSV